MCRLYPTNYVSSAPMRQPTLNPDIIGLLTARCLNSGGYPDDWSLHKRWGLTERRQHCQRWVGFDMRSKNGQIGHQRACIVVLASSPMRNRPTSPHQGGLRLGITSGAETLGYDTRPIMLGCRIPLSTKSAP
jgi:hypothetical protein